MTAAGRSEWVFEEKEVTLLATSMLLVRIMIGKVEKKIGSRAPFIRCRSGKARWDGTV
jgi:hypothetical protein